MIFTDSMQIPVGAPHAFTAQKMIDFVYRPEIQAALTEYAPIRAAGEGRPRDPREAQPQRSRRASWSSRTSRTHTTSSRSPRKRKPRSRPPSSARSARRGRGEPGVSILQRRRGLLPFLLLAPGLAWLLLFFAVPLYYMARQSLEEGTIFTGLRVRVELPDLHGRARELRRAARALVRVRRRRHADRVL